MLTEEITKTSFESIIEDYDKNFVQKWIDIFEHLSNYENRFWLAGPSAYVFSIAGERFAIDLQIRCQKDFSAISDSLIYDLFQLSYILITHQHDDHMCIPLMQALKDTSIRWYMSSGTSHDLIKEGGLKAENIVYVSDGDCWNIGNLKFRAFYSPHTCPGENFPQLGYEITTPEIKLLFPGDIRSYDYNEYPDFGHVDICFSHLWTGNDSLTEQNYIPLFDKFAKFNTHSATMIWMKTQNRMYSNL